LSWGGTSLAAELRGRLGALRDIVENRKRITFARKLRLTRIALRENGVAWCALLLAYYAASTVEHRAFAAMDRLRRTRKLPGINSAALNKEIWEAWDWEAAGDEWTYSDEWKQSLIRSVLEREIPEKCSVLEIGPGGGRWTLPLLERASAYIGVDISSACVEYCLQRFRDHPHARFVVGSGRDLSAVPDATIDAIWSFDVFVHINRAEVESYAPEFARILRPGGLGVIHHGSVGGASGGWRSNMTADAFRKILVGHGLCPLRSLAHWSDGTSVHHLQYGDLITIFVRPE
jgi:SAM-dependent methyltransferase